MNPPFPHAHPSEPARAHARSQSIPPSLHNFQPQGITPKSAPHTRQQILLQTRNARFSAQRLSVSGINGPFPPLNRSTENDSPYYAAPRFNKQNETDRVQTKAEELSNASTESAILNEISNHNAYRVRGLKRRAAIPIFQDSPDKHSNPPSVYHDAFSDIYPLSIPDSLQDYSPTMGLREVSTNLQRPSPGKESPHFRSVRTGRGRRSSQAKPRFNQDEYIEHIESELQSIKDASYSPTTHLPWKEKLKKAKEENHRLKKEMELLKVSFEHELQETVEQSTETELRLKRRIKDLEDEVELKETLIHDLECDRDENNSDQHAVEVLRARIEKLEGERLILEATNRDMTRRSDVLTQLLALSPTKAHPGMELPTPRRRSARPMSLIIPRVPSSPGMRTSQSHSRPQSVLASPALPATDYFPIQLPSSPLASSPEAIDDARSVDSGLGEFCAPVTSGTASRRSTLASHASTSPSMYTAGHPRGETRSQALWQPSKRRPRKFMPGSTQLKPLLLPTFTADHGQLPFTSPITSSSRPVLAQPISQTIAYDLGLSEHLPTSECDDVAISSPEYVTGRPGPAFQSLDEVFAEDESRFASVVDDTLARPSFACHRRQYETPVKQGDTMSAEKHNSLAESHSHPRINSWVLKTISSLPDESAGQSKFDRIGPLVRDDNVDMPPPLFSKHRAVSELELSSPSPSPESPLRPRKRRKTSSIIESHGSRLAGADFNVSSAAKCHTDCQEPPTESDSTAEKAKNPVRPQSPLAERQGSIRARNPLEILQHRGIGSRPLATLTIQTVYATLSRYTNYVQGFKQDPLALARRVIANAWHSNWAMFGKMSWWVLGLFIGHHRSAPGQMKCDWENYDGESIANRCCSPMADPTLPNDPSTQRAQSSSNLDNNDPTDPADTLPKSTASSSLAKKDSRSGWGRSLYLWGKFSVAIMLAVGGAIVQGPAEMLRDADERRTSRRSSLAEEINHNNRRSRLDEADSKISGGRPEFPRQSPAESLRHPEGRRKPRSHSSPPASPSTRDSDDLKVVVDGGTTTQPPQSSAESISEDLALESNDETLKPARSERRGVHSIFQAPDNIDLAGSDNPGKTLLHSGEAGWYCEHDIREHQTMASAETTPPLDKG